MSRKVDTEGKLSEQDKLYLAERGRLPEGAKLSAKQKEVLAPDDSGDAGEDGYDDMSVSELKDVLEARELSKGGSKQDLIERLREDDSGITEE